MRTRSVLTTFGLGLMLTVITTAVWSYNKVKETVTFTTAIAEDATPTVLKRILEIETSPVEVIKFEKGTYHFYPEKGLEKFWHISNHNDVLIRTAFPIIKKENITIDGQGSTFIFHGKMIPFLINQSKNITVKNVSIDWHETFHSEGKIIARNEEENTFDIQIPESYPYIIRNNQLIFIKEYYEHTIGQSILYDPERGGAIAFNTEAYTPITSYKKITVSRNLESIKYKYKVDNRAPFLGKMFQENKISVKELKPGVVRVFNHKNKKKDLPPVGYTIAMKGAQGKNRLAPAFHVTFTDGFNGYNVNVHHAGGMGLIAENSSDLILEKFNIFPSNGRMVSTTADATHFVGCRGKVQLKDCLLSGQLDDGSNIHGTYQEVVDILGPNKIGVRMGHFQQQGFVIGREGDQIGIVRIQDSFFPYEKDLTIKSIEYRSGRYQVITFNQELPSKIKAGDLIENQDAYPEVLVENCTFKNNRARGLLLSVPRKTIVRNNYFHTEMEALLIPVESGHWFEAGNQKNLLVENNVFEDCQHSGFNRGVIRFDTDDENKNIAFSNITITKNIFKQFDNLILQITNVDGLEFSENTITNSQTFPQLHNENPAFKITASKNVNFSDNIYKGKATKIIETDDKQVVFQ
ncbi:right-handed parallel beta-helix repeat-containing protein [Flammeovirga kamogawensis]|nr:right-handed parallel beta-helix repeat-containing protein [Flammeovirga kamogawensis]MBB6463527.1 hypothetical protein [Flammeovirga kamogawensis]